MEAFAAKNIKGDIVQLYMTKPSSVPFPLTCVTVTVSENGDADELLLECKARITELCTAFGLAFPYATFDRIDAYLARKEQ